MCAMPEPVLEPLPEDPGRVRWCHLPAARATQASTADMENQQAALPPNAEVEARRCFFCGTVFRAKVGYTVDATFDEAGACQDPKPGDDGSQISMCVKCRRKNGASWSEIYPLGIPEEMRFGSRGMPNRSS